MGEEEEQIGPWIDRIDQLVVWFAHSKFSSRRSRRVLNDGGAGEVASRRLLDARRSKSQIRRLSCIHEEVVWVQVTMRDEDGARVVRQRRRHLRAPPLHHRRWRDESCGRRRRGEGRGRGGRRPPSSSRNPRISDRSVPCLRYSSTSASLPPGGAEPALEGDDARVPQEPVADLVRHVQQRGLGRLIQAPQPAHVDRFRFGRIFAAYSAPSFLPPLCSRSLLPGTLAEPLRDGKGALLLIVEQHAGAVTEVSDGNPTRGAPPSLLAGGPQRL